MGDAVGNCGHEIGNHLRQGRGAALAAYEVQRGGNAHVMGESVDSAEDGNYAPDVLVQRDVAIDVDNGGDTGYCVDQTHELPAHRQQD